MHVLWDLNQWSVGMKRPHSPFVSIALLIVLALTPSYVLAGAGAKIRPASVAGTFYPRRPEELRQTVRNCLKHAPGLEVPGKIRGLVSPHAGYVYSGVVAAAGYKQIDPSIKTVILLGPSHRFPLKGASIPKVEAYQTPLGEVPLASLAQGLQKLPLFESVSQAHSGEHCLEVQLPFLQVILKDFQIIPILTNDLDPESLAATLAPHVDKDTLVVASSDLSHYHPYDRAVRLDRVFTTAVTNWNFSDMPRCEACGKQAVLTLMHIARIKGWQGMLIDYRNSGDTAGSKDRVVGYASIAFIDRKEASTKMNQVLSAHDKKALLRLARSVIETKLAKGTKLERPETLSPALTAECGCFVTLHKHDQLRGCIGSIEPVSSLVECVEHNAESAAFHDPRFPPVNQEELPEIDIEVSVLTVPERLLFKNGEDLKDQLIPSVHGVILSQGFNRSTFLPQVWKQLPEKEQFLEHLCLKGGMHPKAWQNPETKVEVYRAEAFGEKDVQ